MTTGPFLVLAFGAGALSLISRRMARVSALAGLLGLALAAIAGLAIGDEPALTIAGDGLAGTRFGGLFVVLGCVVGLLLCTVALATTWTPNLPGATLLGLGAATLALGLVDPGTALAAATGGAVAALLVPVAEAAADRGLSVLLVELRAVITAGAVGLAGAAVVAGPLAGGRVDPAILGLAYLAVAVAVAIRFGAFPFHLWASRVAGAAPAVGLPLVMAWGPAAFAVVVLGWIDAAVAPLGVPLDGERLLLALVGLASIVAGTAAALVHDELDHVVGYSIVADAGVALLGLAALGPEAWAPTRTWLLALVVSKSGLAAWAGAIHGEFGTLRLAELGGWARRSPLLLLALVGLGVAAVGWPGLAVFGARDALVALVFDGPAAVLALAASLAGIAIYGRLVLAGLGRQSITVEDAARWRPAWPAGRPRRISLALYDDLVEGWFANRVMIAAAAVLALSSLAVVVSAGGLGAEAAAAGLPPALGQPGESFGPEESFDPGESFGPGGSVVPGASFGTSEG